MFRWLKSLFSVSYGLDRRLFRQFRKVNWSFVLHNDRVLATFIADVVEHYKIDVSNVALAIGDGNALLGNTNSNERTIVMGPSFWTDRSSQSHTADMQFAVLHELRHVIQQNNGWSRFVEDPELILEWTDPNTRQIKLYKHTEIDELWETSTIKYNSLGHEYDANTFAINSPLLTAPDTSGMLRLMRKQIEVIDKTRNG